MSSRVIIFGITGAVGAYTALALRNEGFSVTGVGRRHSDNGFFADYQIPYYSIDIAVKEAFEALPGEDIDSVVHCAGSMPSKLNGYDPRCYIDSIVTGTFNVLEYCLRVNARKIIFTHTRADSSYLMGTKMPIPADIERKFPLTGDHSIYTICKNAAVDMIEHYFHAYGLKRFILRLPTIYHYHPDKYFFVNGIKKPKAYRLLIERAMNGEPIELWGDPTKEKEIVYIKDLVDLIKLAIKSDKDGGIYNVGCGAGVSIAEQIQGIIDVFSPEDKKSGVLYRPDKPDGRQFVHDITKTRTDLGFEPKYDYRNMLVDFKNEMKLNRFGKLWGNGDE
jgi:nucleoside-diphosphate-sugar epimerase